MSAERSTLQKHWADTRAGVFIELPEGATVLVDAIGVTMTSGGGRLRLVVKPMTDQPSAREELAQVLDDAARTLRG